MDKIVWGTILSDQREVDDLSSTQSRQNKIMETWLSGRKRFTANEVRVYSPSRVRIPPSPRVQKSTRKGAFSVRGDGKKQSGGLFLWDSKRLPDISGRNIDNLY